MKLYFGCSQWGYPKWKGHLYPEKAQEYEFLKFYSKIFNTVELNPTYHNPDIDNNKITGWRDKVPSGFKFCPKFPKTISHIRKLINAGMQTDIFLKKAGLFKDKLGVMFLQLPNFFKSVYVLDHYLKSLPKDYKVSVEVRTDVLENENMFLQVLDVLKANNKGLVMVDSLEERIYLNSMKLTSHFAFVRFMVYGLDSDYKRFDSWLEMINKWREKQLPEVYFFLHFPDESGNFKFLDYAIEKFKLLQEEQSKIS